MHDMAQVRTSAGRLCLLLLYVAGTSSAQPMLGLCTWNSFAMHINATLLTSVAQAMVTSGLAHKGYTMLAIDDGWGADQRDANGDIVADPERFPQGMAALGDTVHSLGLKLGLCTLSEWSKRESEQYD